VSKWEGSSVALPRPRLFFLPPRTRLPPFPSPFPSGFEPSSSLSSSLAGRGGGCQHGWLPNFTHVGPCRLPFEPLQQEQQNVQRKAAKREHPDVAQRRASRLPPPTSCCSNVSGFGTRAAGAALGAAASVIGRALGACLHQLDCFGLRSSSDTLEFGGGFWQSDGQFLQ
jgi:hypothetical protein